MIRPVGNYVLVKVVKEDNKKVNGIIMPSAITSLKRGEVVAVGEGTSKDGAVQPITNVILGDTVLWTGMGFDVEDNMTLIPHEAIVAVDNKTTTDTWDER